MVAVHDNEHEFNNVTVVFLLIFFSFKWSMDFWGVVLSIFGVLALMTDFYAQGVEEGYGCFPGLQELFHFIHRNM